MKKLGRVFGPVNWKSKRLCGSRRGFTMIEILASTIFLALIVIAVVKVSMAISDQKTVTQNVVYLSTHNLNCMERIRQMAQTTTTESEGDLLSYYGDDMFGTLEIETEINITTSTLNADPKFHIYSVKITSGIREGTQHLTSNYVLTDIGSFVFMESVGGIDDVLPGELPGYTPEVTETETIETESIETEITEVETVEG